MKDGMHQNIIRFLCPIVVAFHSYAMEPKDDITTKYQVFLKHPAEYADFRLTRSYGKPLKSDFDCLPKDIVKTYVKPFLRKRVAIKLKHECLHNKWQLNQDIPKPLWVPIAERYTQRNPFHYYDGNYTLIPHPVPDDGTYTANIIDYEMWAGKGNSLKKHYDTMMYNESEIEKTVKNLRKIVHKSDSKPEICVYCPEEQYEKMIQNLFYIGKGGESTVTPLALDDTVASCLLSNDGAAILFCSNMCTIFDTIFMKPKNTFLLQGNFVLSCSAHFSSLFAVCSEKEIMLIDPQLDTCHVSFFEAVNIKPQSIEFSPTDKYCCMVGDSDLYMLKVKKDSSTYPIFELVKHVAFKDSIRKTFFISDNSLAIAFADGSLKLWTDFYKEPWMEDYLYEPIWRWSLDNADDKSPIFLLDQDNDLLFVLDPVDYQNKVDKFTILKASNGKCLATHKIFPRKTFSYEIKGMGISKDKKTIVFMDEYDDMSQLHLYDDEEIRDIQFITEQADWYQLCCLAKTARFNTFLLDNYTVGIDKKNMFVNTIRSFIKSYSSK